MPIQKRRIRHERGRTMEIDGSGGMDLESAARVLGVHYQTAYQWVRSGLLPSAKVGLEYRVNQVDVERLAETRRARRPLTYTGRRRDWDRLREQCYDALVAGDETGARRVFERLRLARVPLVDQTEELLAPAMHRIGEGFEAGTVSSATCRVAAGIGERMLAWAVCCLDDPATEAPLAMVVTPKGDDHRLPALMAGAVLRDGGWAARHIEGVAVGEVVDVARRLRPSLAVVSFALPDLAEAAAEIREELGEAAGITVLVGGPGEPLSALQALAGPRI
jgi:MerR family transcriptional regulator, light-induced transcriptional regulator